MELYFGQFMQDLHLAEQDQQVAFFYCQVAGDFADHGILDLFQSDQVAFFFGAFDADKAHAEIFFQVYRL